MNSKLLKLRKFIRANQVLGMTIKKSDYGLGWEIGHISTPWTLATIYIDQAAGFSFYQAIPDIDKGIQCSDEKLIINTREVFLLKCRWHSFWQVFFYGPPSTVVRDMWEGKMLQRF